MLNPAHSSKSDTYYNQGRPSIVSRVADGPHRILDLGCGSGAVGRRLQELGRAAQIVGVEIFPEAARAAARSYTKMHVGDIEHMELPYGAEFDYVLCGDILEHLKDPYAVVARIRGWLKPGGTFICSVPNVRHWGVLMSLIFAGEWRYRDAGIMDRTHLRFFTRRSSVRMIQDAGLRVVSWEMLVFGRKFRLLNAVSLGLLAEFVGSQTVLVARKDDPSAAA